MTKRIPPWRLLALVCVLASIVLPAAPALALDPDVVPVPQNSPPGIYVFYDWTKVDPARSPIVGGQMNFVWKDIEYQKWKYSWGNVDKFVSDMAAQGKKAVLRLTSYNGECCGGSAVPSFHKTSTPSIVVTCPSASSSGQDIPRYWDGAYKYAWEQLVKAFGARYNKDARVAYVEIGAGVFGETSPAEDKFDACLEGAGLTSNGWVSTVNWATDIYRAAFPNKQLVLMYAPRYLSAGERREFADYAASKGVALKHNGLRPDGGSDMFITDPTHHAYKSGQYDPLADWGSQVPLGFEGTESSVGLADRTSTLWSVYNALDKRTDWLMVDTAVATNANYQDILQFATRYLGKPAGETPSAWAALRETEYDWFADYGNYEFYLYQRDAAPGGKTVPLYKVGTAPEGRYTRRTDQGTGNSSMFFDVDDGYAYGGNYQGTITVTYYDTGTDRWELRYNAGNGVERVGGSVTKKNTRTWKTIAFPFTDVQLVNSQAGGTDFRIWSAQDGDETIHKVDIVATPGKPKSMTLQPGVDGYTGAVDTYLNSWYPDRTHATVDQMWVGYPDKMYGALRFDLAPLPAHARVVTATLSLYQSGGTLAYPVDLTLGAHRLLRAWDEGSATWNKATAAVSWQQPGAAGPADREASAAGTAKMRQTFGWYNIDITSLVQMWSDDAEANKGVLLRGETDRNAQFYFYTSEATSVSLRPKLEIHYYESLKVTPTPTVTPRATSTSTRTPTATLSPTPSPTGARTNTPTPSPTATSTATPTATATPTGTATATVTTSTRRELISRFAVSPPVIDGELNEWRQPERVTVDSATADHVDFQPAPPAADISTVVQSYWDADFLYFAVQVTDDTPWRDSDQVWHDDSIELALDGANDQLALRADDHQLTIAYDGAITDLGNPLSPQVLQTFKIATRKRTGGYAIEVAIPRAYLGAGGLSEGKILGFTIGLNDDDDGGKRSGMVDSWLVWEGHNTYNTPADYGQLVLGGPFDHGQPSPTPTVTFTPSATPSITPTEVASATPSPSATATPSPTPTVTHTPVLTPTPTATGTPIPGGRVWGRIWLDRNNNRTFDTGEPGVMGITLFLATTGANAPEGAGEAVRTAVSQANGLYEFGAISAGNYTLTVEEHPNLRATTPRKVALYLSAAGDALEVSFGVNRTTAPVYLPLLRKSH